MNEQFKDQITAKAREFATAYTNRHFPNQPAFAFGNEGWAKFVDALVELSHPKSIEADSGVMKVGAHPDKGTSAPVEKVYRCVGCKHVYFESSVSCDCEVPALRNFTSCHIVDAAPVVPAPEARDEWRELFWSVARALNCLPSTYVDGNAHVYKQAEKYAAIATAAPVAQLSELPKLAFDESHIDYIDRYDGFCRDCADEDGVCPSSGLPCGGSKKAIRHVLTALAYGVNHGYIPVVLAAAPTTPNNPAPVAARTS